MDSTALPAPLAAVSLPLVLPATAAIFFVALLLRLLLLLAFQLQFLLFLLLRLLFQLLLLLWFLTVLLLVLFRARLASMLWLTRLVDRPKLWL